MLKICFVAHFSYGALTGGEIGHMGGVERQTSLMSGWLAARGHRVSVLTWDEGQTEACEIDGVQVIKMCRSNAGIPGLRFFHPRWTSLNRAMRLADADLYYQNCGEYVTGQVGLWCQCHGRVFVYSTASDPDCDPNLPEMHTFRERFLYRYGLSRAHSVIVQTRRQQQMLREGFNVASIVLPMPCPGPDGVKYDISLPSVALPRVLWVGRISRVKRLEVLIDIAAALPHVAFDVVGTPDVDDDYSRDLLGRARGLSNVVLHGRIAPRHMPDMYRRAGLLCCTSQYEGFPNTFLEAWSMGVPVVSTVDPDNLITDRELGYIARDQESIIGGIRALLDSPQEWKEASQNARLYYLENHAVGPAMNRFERLFSDLMARGRCSEGCC